MADRSSTARVSVATFVVPTLGLLFQIVRDSATPQITLRASVARWPRADFSFTLTSKGGARCEPAGFRSFPGSGLRAHFRDGRWSARVSPGEPATLFFARCDAFGFRVTAAEMTIAKGDESASWADGGPVGIEATGGARVHGRGNLLSGETILMEFDSHAVAERMTVVRPRESGAAALLPLQQSED